MHFCCLQHLFSGAIVMGHYKHLAMRRYDVVGVKVSGLLTKLFEQIDVDGTNENPTRFIKVGKGQFNAIDIATDKATEYVIVLVVFYNIQSIFLCIYDAILHNTRCQVHFFVYRRGEGGCDLYLKGAICIVVGRNYTYIDGRRYCQAAFYRRQPGLPL